MKNYQEQANSFLAKTNTGFKAEFIKHDKYFDDDKEPRDIYRITLTRGTRSYEFNFGQSINASGRFWLYGNSKRGSSIGRFSKKENKWLKPLDMEGFRAWEQNPNFSAPTPYDVLASLTKYDPGTFENFCADFGYDTDSRKAEKIYNAVCREYENLKMLFSDDELELMQEIN